MLYVSEKTKIISEDLIWITRLLEQEELKEKLSIFEISSDLNKREDVGIFGIYSQDKGHLMSRKLYVDYLAYSFQTMAEIVNEINPQKKLVVLKQMFANSYEELDSLNEYSPVVGNDSVLFEKEFARDEPVSILFENISEFVDMEAIGAEILERTKYTLGLAKTNNGYTIVPVYLNKGISTVLDVEGDEYTFFEAEAVKGSLLGVAREILARL